MNGGATGRDPGPLLEIAYWIGPSPGVTPTAAQETSMNLNQYRDRSRGRTGTDRWVVFHIHFHPGPHLLDDWDETTYIGTNSIRMYHGQTASVTRGAIRVDNRDTDARSGHTPINSRSGLVTCPDNTPWYIGMPTVVPSLPNVEQQFQIELQDWGRSLWENNYVNSNSLSYIFNVNAWNRYGEIDLDAGQPSLSLTSPNAAVAQYNWRWNPQTGQYETNPYVPN